MPTRPSRLSGVEIGAIACGGILLAGAILRRPRSRPAIAIARNAGAPVAPARSRTMPRPLRRVRPRLQILQGGQQPVADALALQSDPFQGLLERLFATDPTPGHFVQVVAGDTPESIARTALGSVGRFTKKNLLDYIHLFSSSSYNLARYGSPSTSRAYPSYWRVPGFGQGLRAAFLPRNEDAIDAIAHRRLPKRTTHPQTGEALGEHTHYAVIWLPPVSADDLRRGIVTCAHESWADGSSSIDPPPEFLAYLEAAA